MPYEQSSIISVNTEDDLALLDPATITLGTKAYVGDDKAYFGMLVSGRPIAVEDTDEVVASTQTWTFANGNFRSTDVGCSFTIAGTADNDGTYEIESVTDPETVVTVEAPVGDETFDTAGITLVLDDAPLAAGSVVAVAGRTGARWFVDVAAETAGFASAPISGTGTEADPFTIEAEAIPGSALEDGAVDNDQIADGAVTPAKTTGIPHGWTRIDIGVNAQDQVISVTGQTASVIEVMGYVVNPNGSDSDIHLLWNGLSTDQSQQASGAANNVIAAGIAAINRLGYAVASGGKTSFQFRISLKTGSFRFAHGTNLSLSAADAVTDGGNLLCVWKDSATEVTSLTVHSSVATGLGAGSWLLYRIIPEVA